MSIKVFLMFMLVQLIFGNIILFIVLKNCTSIFKFRYYIMYDNDTVVKVNLIFILAVVLFIAVNFLIKLK